MIDKAFDVLKRDMQNFLTHLDLNITSEPVVHTTPIVHADGNIAIPERSLGLTLVNIEEERAVKSQVAVSQAPNGRVSHMNPEIKLNLYFLIAAYHSNYDTGLEYLSGAIRFFQSKNVFTTQNTPDLDPTIQKLIVELYTLSFEQQNYLWGALGAKYMPSVMYKMRMIAIQEAQKIDEQAPITIVNFSENRM